MSQKAPLASLTALASVLGLAAPALAENAKVVFGTNWLAQAEHGGFYQAVADGTYAACGLDVTIQPGGPQVNNRALMIAGKVDYHMGGNLLEAFSAAEEGIPIVAVAAAFQKEPQVILTHPGKAETFEDLKKLDKILIGDQGYASFYQWMKAAYGFTDEQREVYTFNPAPFIANENWGMQGYLSSEPYFVAKETGWEPGVFLIADAGYSTYSTLIETMADTIATKPEQVQCFVEGSIKGWYNYLYNDNTAANAMIKADNPEMTDEAIAYAIDKMKEAGIVDSGDALTMGIGAMTEEQVKDFFDKMVEAGVVSAEVDWSATINTSFVNKGVGMELKPKM
jgi:NitT/TauT family transport system substrate-binding protein